MNIAIFTEESGVKLPKHNKWKNSFGRGKPVEKNEEIISLLKKNNLSLPKYDLELEEKYSEVLSIYTRPAKNMFAGMFSEVRDFNDYLSESFPTSFYIISGRYGLLSTDETIIPYSSHINDETDLEDLSRRTNFTEKMIEKAKSSDIILFFLPSHYINYLLAINLFGNLDSKQVIIVSSKYLKKEFSSATNVTVLERKGVARIGGENRKKILEIISYLTE